MNTQERLAQIASELDVTTLELIKLAQSLANVDASYTDNELKQAVVDELALLREQDKITEYQRKYANAWKSHVSQLVSVQCDLMELPDTNGATRIHEIIGELNDLIELASTTVKTEPSWKL